MSEEILPDSRLKDHAQGTRVMPFANVNRLSWTPIFCANCGKGGGYVPEETCTFAFYLCDGCAEKWAPLAGTLAVPDEVFWKKVKEAQLEKYGRLLTAEEIAAQLEDGDSMLAKLARDGGGRRS
jgi:hypothetical protein